LLLPYEDAVIWGDRTHAYDIASPLQRLGQLKRGRHRAQTLGRLDHPSVRRAAAAAHTSNPCQAGPHKDKDTSIGSDKRGSATITSNGSMEL
ncbi:unnamed protein product, partial [Ectocarpus sp. 12 AP-2014]